MRALCILIGVTTFATGGPSCSSVSEWPFDESRNTLVVTQRAVITEHRTILAVVRSAADGQWMFLADENPAIDVVVTLTLEEMMNIDQTIKEVADLPPGWKAVRHGPGQTWQRLRL